jgi:hypothetical protein
MERSCVYLRSIETDKIINMGQRLKKDVVFGRWGVIKYGTFDDTKDGLKTRKRNM